SIVMGRALAPVEQAIAAWKALIGARQAYGRLREHFTAACTRSAGMALPRPSGRLSVEQISFALPKVARPILRGITFTLEPGEAMALIGPSASGKTTLARLLVGTRRPSLGSVRLDGADVFDWQREDFGRYVGYLPQDVELFDGTVRDNIARLGDASPESV